MGKILGLDLGTNSIGWAVVERDYEYFGFPESNGHPTKGVVIFPEGVKQEPKTKSEKSRAAERTGFRSARKLKFRRKLRKYETLLTLAKNKMCPLAESEVKEWKKSGFKNYPDNEAFLNWLRTNEQDSINPYYFRDKFSRKKYDWEKNPEVAFELGRALYHLAQRRGFKSNRLEQSDENIIAEKKEQIQDALNEAENSATLFTGINEIFADYDFENKTKDDLNATEQKLKSTYNYIIKVLSDKVKGKDYSKFDAAKAAIDNHINRAEYLGAVKGGIKELMDKIQNTPGCNTLGQYFFHLYQQNRHDAKNKIRKHYTAREEHYEQEFNEICKKQQLPEQLKTSLYKTIFFQRPLKSQKGLVGKCTFENDKSRCPVSRPEFEEFRMWAFINNIKIKTPQDEHLRPLTQAEKTLIIPKFYRAKSTFKFDDIAKALNASPGFTYYKDREAREAQYLINYKLNTTVSGCPVSTSLKNIMESRVGDNWKTKKYPYKTRNAKGVMVDRTADYVNLWHVLFTFDDDKKLKSYVTEKLGIVDEATAKKFSKISLQQGYANLSLKAINKIIPWLEKGLIYSHAVFMANIDKVVDEAIWKNPADRQLIEKTIGEIIEHHTDETRKINAVNALIRTYRDEEAEYSKEAEPAFRDDLENKLKAIYGQKNWSEKTDRETYLAHAFELLKKQLKKIRTKDAFVKVKRIDDQVIEFLLDNDLIHDPEKDEDGKPKRLKKLYHPSDLENFKPEKAKDKDGNPIIVRGKQLEILPLPKTVSIKNPVLIRAMHYLRRLINELLRNGVIESSTRIHIELAREVNDSNKRAAWKTWQDRLRDRRENAINEIKELYKAECGKEVEPTEDDITRYLLWEEQEKREIYEDECNNISICDIIGADPKYDIEHTIPRSRSWDNSMMNKTLCSKAFNRDKKRNQIPFELGKEKHEEILLRIENWKKEYLRLENDIKRINASRITDKETKDKMIQKRHLLQFEYEYLKGKYQRFAMEEVPEGFKNSQIVDTGLITRFAKNYLSCLFRTQSDNSNVLVVNGQTVSEFRKAWGLQDEYEKKSRASHLHHCMDAVTVACMTKDKYDAFVEQWRKAEEEGKRDVKFKIKIPKPWETFTEDIKKLENELLVVHANKDNVPKQSKRKERKRGRIQYLMEYEKDSKGNYKRDDKGKKIIKKDIKGKVLYRLDKNGNRIPKILQGETVRGALHLDTFYGAIKLPEIDEKTGKSIRDEKNRAILKRNDRSEEQIFYVVRKEISKISKKDIFPAQENEGIVDITVRGKFQQAVNEGIASFKMVQKKEMFKLKDGEKIWMNKEKGIPINKVRVFASTFQNPLPGFKSHAQVFQSSKEYKRQFNVQNADNYCMVFYDNGAERDFELINNYGFAKARGLGKKFYPDNKVKMLKRKELLLPVQSRNGRDIVVKKGTLVVFYEIAKEKPEEVLMGNDIEKRMYEIDGLSIQRIKRPSGKIDEYGVLTFKLHNEARKTEDLNQLNYKPDGDFKVGEYKPTRKMNHNQFNALIEGIDFKLTTTGKILKKEKYAVHQVR